MKKRKFRNKSIQEIFEAALPPPTPVIQVANFLNIGPNQAKKEIDKLRGSLGLPEVEIKDLIMKGEIKVNTKCAPSSTGGAEDVGMAGTMLVPISSGKPAPPQPPPMRQRLGGQPAANPAVPTSSYPAILGGDDRYEYLYQQIAEDIKDKKELEEIAKKIAKESKVGNGVSARSLHFTNIKKEMKLTTEQAIDMLLNKNPEKLKKFEQFMRDKKIGAFLGVAEEILPINTVRELAKMIPESLRLNRIKLANILF